MSAEERVKAELEFTESGPRYLEPAVLAVRMQFWDQGLKNEPKCLDKSLGPDDVTSCECMKAGPNRAIVCTATEGYKCLMRYPLNPLWKAGAAKEKGIDTCNPTFPARTPQTEKVSVPVGAVLVKENYGYVAIGVGIVLLILIALGKLK